MSIIAQQDFSAGVVQSRKAPANAVYDALNALVDDEGNLFRRGGSAYYTPSDIAGTNPIEDVWDGYLSVGPRTVLLSAGPSKHVFVLDPSTLAPIDLGLALGTTQGAIQSMVEVAGTLFWSYVSPTNTGITMYAGATTSATFGSGSGSAGTATYTNGSKTVTGVGTNFSTGGGAAGMLFSVGDPVTTGPALGDQRSLHVPIDTVTSNTSLTLRDPWPGPTGSSGNWGIATVTGPGYNIPVPGSTQGQWRYLGVVAQRLLLGVGGRMYASDVGVPSVMRATVYLEFGLGARIIGLSSIENTAFVFATNGVWTVSNMELDPVDDFGNQQWRQAQISRDVILWGDHGIAAWANRLIVPALDDIYLFSTGAAPEAISAAIRSSYRAYIAAGYAPGQAAVHRGHYFLPIVDGSGVVQDVFVCRLDRGFAWTRWSGHAASAGFAQQSREAASPKLLGFSARRVTDLTSCLNTTGNASDADSSTPTFQFDTSDFDTGPGVQPSTVLKVRGQYETTGGTPTFAVSYAVGPAGASFTAGTLKRGGGASDGTGYSAWRIGKAADRVRFRVSTDSAVTSLIWRGLEVHIRSTGRT